MTKAKFTDWNNVYKNSGTYPEIKMNKETWHNPTLKEAYQEIHKFFTKLEAFEVEFRAFKEQFDEYTKRANNSNDRKPFAGNRTNCS
jgi:hypothetical protein